MKKKIKIGRIGERQHLVLQKRDNIVSHDACTNDPPHRLILEVGSF